jgi:hypothetical protein
MPLLKLDVKFEFPMYDGEVNAQRLDNWVRQMEFYCSVQQIKDVLDTSTTLRGGVNECGALFKTSPSQNSLDSNHHLIITYCCHL